MFLTGHPKRPSTTALHSVFCGMIILMDKFKRFIKSKFCFAIILTTIFALVQLPIIWHHELSLPESQFYHQYFAPLGISYAIARYVPLAFTALIVFLMSWLLPFRRITKVCIAFSALFFYFNSVLLIGFRIIPLGRELVFANPIEFFTSLNESIYHTRLPIAQICLIPIVIFL